MSKKIRTFFSPGSEPGEKGFPPSVTDQSADVSAGALIAKYVRSGVPAPKMAYGATTAEEAANLIVDALQADGFDLSDIPAILERGKIATRELRVGMQQLGVSPAVKPEVPPSPAAK